MKQQNSTLEEFLEQVKLIEQKKALLKTQFEEEAKTLSPEQIELTKFKYDSAINVLDKAVNNLAEEFYKADSQEKQNNRQEEQSHDSKNIFDRIVAVKHALVNGITNIAEITKNTVLNTKDTFANKMEAMRCDVNIAARDAFVESRAEYAKALKEIEQSVGDKVLVKNQVKNEKTRAKLIKGQLKDFKNPRKRLIMQKDLIAKGFTKEKANEQIEKHIAKIERKSINTLRKELKAEHASMGGTDQTFKDPFKPTTSFEEYAQSMKGRFSLKCNTYNVFQENVQNLDKLISEYDKDIEKQQALIKGRNEKVAGRKDILNVGQEVTKSLTDQIKDAGDKVKEAKEKAGNKLKKIGDNFKDAEYKYQQNKGKEGR